MLAAAFCIAALLLCQQQLLALDVGAQGCATQLARRRRDVGKRPLFCCCQRLPTGSRLLAVRPIRFLEEQLLAPNVALQRGAPQLAGRSGDVVVGPTIFLCSAKACLFMV